MPFPPVSLVQMVAVPTAPHLDRQSESDSAARVTYTNNVIPKRSPNILDEPYEPFEEE